MLLLLLRRPRERWVLPGKTLEEIVLPVGFFVIAALGLAFAVVVMLWRSGMGGSAVRSQVGNSTAYLEPSATRCDAVRRGATRCDKLEKSAL